MTRKADKTLAYAVRSTALARYGGLLAIALVGIGLVPALVAIVDGDLRFALPSGGIALILATLGLGLSRVNGPRDLMSNEALVVIALGYLVTAVLMSWPLAADGIAPLDAFFHSMSAVTTTGLSTLGSVESRSQAFLFTQAWMQWYGGLVIVVLAVFLVGPGAAAKRLAANEIEDSDVLAGTRTRAMRTLMLYTGLTLIGMLILLLTGAGWFDALVHALSATSTGGFSSHDASLAGFDSLATSIVTILLALGGAISFAFYQGRIWHTRPGQGGLQTLTNLQVIGLFVACAIAIATLSMTMLLVGDRPAAEVWRDAPLLAISAQTTAGFSPTSVAALDGASKAVLVVSMLVGGDLGSTAGGIKIFRVLLLLRLMQITMLRTTLPPHAVARPALGRRNLEDRDIEDAVGVVALYVVVLLLSWFAFLAQGHAALDSLFEVTSALGTVGLSAGLSAPGLEPFLKSVLIVDMWMGRLDIVAVLILCRPTTWIGRRAETS
jgi:trk system potassium uptake protein TrkH